MTRWKCKKKNRKDKPSSKGISWPAWVFDADWFPKMIESRDTYELTGCCEFFKEAMAAHQATP